MVAATAATEMAKRNENCVARKINLPFSVSAFEGNLNGVTNVFSEANESVYRLRFGCAIYPKRKKK